MRVLLPSGLHRLWAAQVVAWLRKHSATGTGLALAAAYVLTGKLSLLLALPPGYASAIFPPAGIAVAASFIGGRRTWPWIFAGSALLNLGVGYSAAQGWTWIGVAAAGTIALASVLQAAAGGWCLRRFIGYPTLFDKTGEVLKFLLLAPLVCLVSSSLSVGGLTALGVFAAADSATDWFTWWIGDTLGVIVLLPIVLVVAGRPRAPWRARALTVAAPMLLAFALVVLVFVQATKWEFEDSLSEFRFQSQSLAELLQTEFRVQEHLLEQIEAFLSNDATRPVSRSQFKRYAQAFLGNFPMVQAIEWAPRVAGARRLEFESRQRADFPHFQIGEQDGAGHLRAAADRPDYFPVTYVEPVESNREAVGFDLESQRDRRETLTTALREGIPVASPPVRLVQEKEEQSGILLMRRVTQGGNAPGVVLTVLRVRDFVNRTNAVDRSAFRILLLDVASQGPIYGTSEGLNSRPLFERTLTYGTRLYRLKMQPTEQYLARHRQWKSWTVLALGLFGSGLLGALLLLLGSGVTRRREAEERLALTLVGADLAMTDWDVARDRIVYGSGWTKLLGYAPGDLGAKSTDLAALVHRSDAPAARHALIRHLKGDTPTFEAEVRMRHRSGHWVWVLARWMAVDRDVGGRVLRVAGTGMDITARKQAEEEVARLASTDSLTGAANRRTFLEQLETALARVKRFSESASLLMVDIDHFKAINDTYRHAGGDTVLKHFAGVCQSRLRRVDLLGRLGGEEFGILLAGADCASACEFANQLRQRLADTPACTPDVSIAFTVSIGVTQIGRTDSDAETVLGRADVALYRAKDTGRNRVDSI